MIKKLYPFLSIITFVAFPQSNPPNSFLLDWEEPSSFIANKINKVTCFSFTITNEAKVTKDSTLVCSYFYNINYNSISGINKDFILFSDFEIEKDLSNFENFYSPSNKILKKIKYCNPRLADKANLFEKVSHIDSYAYDAKDQRIIEKNFIVRNSYSTIANDTVFKTKTISNPRIREIEYDPHGRERFVFQTIDSTSVSATASFNSGNELLSSCNDCIPKFLQVVYNYSPGKTEIVRYSFKGKVESKSHLFFSEDKLLLKQIDSTGYYLPKPYLHSEKSITYNNDEIIEVTTFFNETKPIKTETKKYKNKQLVYEFTSNENQEYNIEVNYSITPKKIVKTTNYFKNGIHVVEYYFNKKGLLAAEKHFSDKLLTDYKKYYYE